MKCPFCTVTTTTQENGASVTKTDLIDCKYGECMAFKEEFRTLRNRLYRRFCCLRLETDEGEFYLYE